MSRLPLRTSLTFDCEPKSRAKPALIPQSLRWHRLSWLGSLALLALLAFLLSHLVRPLVVFRMRKHVPNVGSVAVVVNRRDDAELVSADVEYCVRGDVVCCAKSPFDRVKVRKF